MQEITNNNSSNIDILYYIANDRLQSQIHRIDGLDNKIGMTFGLANGLLIALIGYIALLNSSALTDVLLRIFNIATRPTDWWTITFCSCSIIAYLLCLTYLYDSYRIGKWDYRPNLIRLKEICKNPQYSSHDDIVKEWVADECIIAYEYNKPLLERKASKAAYAIYALETQSIFFALSGIFRLFT